MNPIPAPYRILALAAMLLTSIGFGYVQGISRESDRRDAIDLTKERAAETAFQKALENGKRHAVNVIVWQKKSEIYYRNWQEKLKNEKDGQLAECIDRATGTPIVDGADVRLGIAWIRLYNAAWLPEFDQARDTGGAAGEVVGSGTVTPRDALDNISINARSCAKDRKRLDELIDHLNEME